MILISYVLMIKWGPKFMDDRRPFDLKNVMMIYNLIQVILNTYVGIDVSSVDVQWAPLTFSNNFLIQI